MSAVIPKVARVPAQISKAPMSSRSRPPSRSVDDDKTGTARGGFPAIRMRRNRQAPWSRRLVARDALSPSRSDLADVRHRRRRPAFPVASMPGVERLSVDLIVEAARKPFNSAFRRSRSFRSPIQRSAPTTRARLSTPTTSSAARRARSRRRSSISASSSTSRSTPTPATATTACSSAMRSSTTRPTLPS